MSVNYSDLDNQILCNKAESTQWTLRQFLIKYSERFGI